MNQTGEAAGRFRHLKRTVSIGEVVIFGWFGFLGGYMSLRDGDSFGWAALGVGVAMLVLPFTGIYRSHLNILASHRAFPIIVFLPNLLLILMFGSSASIYLRDPFLAYNDSNTLAAIVFGGATLLATAALVANVIAYISDLRS